MFNVQASELSSRLRQVDAVLAWLVLGWLGHRMSWTVLSGVLPLVVWWSVRCVGVKCFKPSLLSALIASSLAALIWLTVWALSIGGLSFAALLLLAFSWGWCSAALAVRGGNAAPSLSGHAMGLMMGTVWLSSQWCLGSGWSQTEAVALHFALMLGVPCWLGVWRKFGPASYRPTAAGTDLILSLGAGLLAWPSLSSAERLVGMTLLVLAWALSLDRKSPQSKSLHAIGTQFWVGPAILLGVGWLSPAWGPVALQTAWGVLAFLSTLSAIGVWRHHATVRIAHRWRDA